MDLKSGTVAVYRPVRVKGDTKTRKSRRVLKLPTEAVQALRAHHTRQAAERLAAGEMRQEHDLVFILPPLSRALPMTQPRLQPVSQTGPPPHSAAVPIPAARLVELAGERAAEPREADLFGTEVGLFGTWVPGRPIYLACTSHVPGR